MCDFQLYHADCLDVLEHQLAPNSVDLVLADIPYGTTRCAWDAIIPLDKMWKAIKRVSTRRACTVLFSSQPFTSFLVVSNLKKIQIYICMGKRVGHWSPKRKQATAKIP